MPWFKVDDDFHDHPKVQALNPGSVGLWTLCGSWSADNLTDGFVPAHIAQRKGGKNWGRFVDELVAAGLWDVVPADTHVSNTRVTREYRSRRDMPAGYQFHDWAEYQPTRDEVKAERARAAARQRAKRDRTKAARHGVTQRRDVDAQRPPRNTAREEVSHDPDPYVPNGTSRGGPGTSDSPGTRDTNINGFDPKPTPPGWRDPAVEALLAETRAKLRPGRPLRNTPPTDPNPKGGA